MAERARWFLAADVGGTFTDLVLLNAEGGTVLLDKVSSAATASGEGVLTGIERLCARADITPDQIELFVHGFTVGTNAFLTRRGARALLLVSEGFRDLLLIGDQMRPLLYDLQVTKPSPVVPRRLTLEVQERLDAFGKPVVSLDAQEIERVAVAVVALAPEAVAICLSFSFLNAQHEEALAEALRAKLPSVPLYLSSRVNPAIEEYPRANTTAIAAYVGPVVGGYVDRLSERLRQDGVVAPLRLMRSDGGIATPRAVQDNPAQMLLSGPAAGVVAGAELAAEMALSDLVTFDMGGTSADFSLIRGGQPQRVPERVVAGQPLRLPALDLETISAGGGSIATVDLAGALRVGPDSAGAEPGPACYGRGGDKATVTDAALLLGLLSADSFLGGEMPLDPAAAEAAVDAEVAQPLGIAVDQAAAGILAVAIANMVQAIRTLTVERGHDIRGFALVAAGGAGPLYACTMARELGMAEVVVPPYPGLYCALGLLQSDLLHTRQRAWRRSLTAIDAAELGAEMAALQDALSADLDADGVESSAQRIEFEGDLRALGQFHQLQIPLAPPGEGNWWDASALAAVFHQRHEQVYGHADPSEAVEIVNLRARGIGRMARPKVPQPEPASAPLPPPLGQRQVLLNRATGWQDCPFWQRQSLAPGHRLEGPAIIMQRDSTTVVLAGQSLSVDASGALRIAVGERA